MDPARLAAVRATGLVGTAAEPVFDDLAGLAARLVGAPLAFVTVVDGERSWWKSCIGGAADGPRSNLVEESFCQYVIGSGEELIVNDAANDPRTRENPSVKTMGVRAWAGFPVRSTDGHVLGTFCVVDTVVRTWTERDIEVLATLAAAVSREIELRASIAAMAAASQVVARGEQRFRTLADQAVQLSESLQVGLLPDLDPACLRIGVHTRYQPGEDRLLLGGDLFDVIRTPDGSLAFLIGDVAGHGAIPAAVGASLRAAWRSLALTQEGSAGWIDALELVFGSERVDEELFVTVCTGTLDPDCTSLTVRSAGHPPPVVRHGDGRVEVLTMVNGPPVGLGHAGTPRPPATFDLDAGWALLLCTDGLFEGRSAPGAGSRLGLEEVARRFGDLSAGRRPDGATLDRLLDSVTDSNGGAIEDDVAVVLLHPLDQGEEPSAT